MRLEGKSAWATGAASGFGAVIAETFPDPIRPCTRAPFGAIGGGSVVEEVGRMSRAVTCLFVPGDRPGRFEKAIATGAILVSLDLANAAPCFAGDPRLPQFKGAEVMAPRAARADTLAKTARTVGRRTELRPRIETVPGPKAVPEPLARAGETDA